MAQKKRVRCIETGDVFDSLTEAGRWIGHHYPPGPNSHSESSHSSVSKAIIGYRGAKTAGGYNWELINEETYRQLNANEEESLPKIYKKLKRKPPKQEKVDYPPEGYVYIFRNRWHPDGVYKIGSTDDLKGRRATARTWGPYNCEFYLEVSNCKLVESKVHEKLKGFLIKDGDLGKEHFSVDLDKAKSVIREAA